MSLMGGAGMLSVTIWSPIIGSWIESAANQAKASGLTGNDLALASGQAALGNLVIFPLILIVAFAGFYWFMRKEKSEQTVHS